MHWVGMMGGQIGTVLAVRTRHEPLRSVGIFGFSNDYLLRAIAGVFPSAALFTYVPPLRLLGTVAIRARYLVLLIPYPFIVCGADELRKWGVQRRAADTIR